MAYQFETEWNENTPIEWWNKARKRLNAIIRRYNQWQIDGYPADETPKLLANIAYGRQTIGSMDGGDGYDELLEKMEKFVNHTQKERNANDG